tara:strand:- start:16812 stop:17012 length:201 start_codon:yes stop_codon:yes gene_type:complete
MEHTEKTEPNEQPKQPKIERKPDRLPSAVVFYMSWSQRRALLNAIKPMGENRSRALLIALGLHEIA